MLTLAVNNDGVREDFRSQREAALRVINEGVADGITSTRGVLKEAALAMHRLTDLDPRDWICRQMIFECGKWVQETADLLTTLTQIGNLAGALGVGQPATQESMEQFLSGCERLSYALVLARTCCEVGERMIASCGQFTRSCQGRPVPAQGWKEVPGPLQSFQEFSMEGKGLRQIASQIRQCV